MTKKYYIKDNVCTPYKLILNRINSYLSANGWVPVASPEESDTAIIGTCAAFRSLENESVEYIKQAKRNGTELIVFGCFPNISPERVMQLKPDRVISSARWTEFEKLIDNPTVRMNEIEEVNEFRLKEDYRLYDPGKQFVLIQTGCSSNCPYCPHKLGIGDLKSYPPEEILRQIGFLVKKDVHTIVLTGNDTGSYGTDIGNITFPELLRRILEISPKIHLSQLNPDWVYEYRKEFAQLFMDKKIKDLQVLIQTVSERLLDIMKRKPVVMKLKPFLKKLRENRSDIVFRTDIMVGFPTATEAEEMNTFEFVAELFDEVAIHGFERFAHTEIEKMNLPFYPQHIIDERMQEALDFFRQYPKILVHHGGQRYKKLIDMEKPKDDLRRAKDAH